MSFTDVNNFELRCFQRLCCNMSSKMVNDGDVECTQSIQLDDILHQQNLLFDGFVRTEILNNLSNVFQKLLTQDVIKLCSTFYELNIKLLSKNKNEAEGLHIFAKKCTKNNEYFIAHKIMQLLIRYYPNKAIYYHTYAEILSCYNLMDEADTAYQTAISIAPNNKQYIYNYGLFLQKQKKYRLALAQFINSDDAEYIFQRAICHTKLNNFESAKECFIKAIELAPHSSSMKVQYGKLLKLHGMYKQALDMFFVAIKEQITAGAFLHIAECYDYLKDNYYADEYYLKAIEIDGGKAQRYCGSYARYLCSVIGDLDESKKYYMKAIEIEPDNAMAYSEYAWMLRDFMRDYAESEKHYLKALEIDSQSRRINGAYGYLLCLMGQYEKARERMDIGLDEKEKLYPNFYRGLIHKMLGNDELAEREILKYVEFLRPMPVRMKHIHLKYMTVIRENDELSKEYWDRFEKLVKGTI